MGVCSSVCSGSIWECAVQCAVVVFGSVQCMSAHCGSVQCSSVCRFAVFSQQSAAVPWTLATALAEQSSESVLHTLHYTLHTPWQHSDSPVTAKWQHISSPRSPPAHCCGCRISDGDQVNSLNEWYVRSCEIEEGDMRGSWRMGEGNQIGVMASCCLLLLLLVVGGQGRQAPCTQLQARKLQVCTAW